MAKLKFKDTKSAKKASIAGLWWMHRSKFWFFVSLALITYIMVGR